MSQDERLTVTLRLHPELRDKLRESAMGRSHSMNAEIIARLENSFEDRDSAEVTGITKIFGGFFKRFATPRGDSFSLADLAAEDPEFAARLMQIVADRNAGTKDTPTPLKVEPKPKKDIDSLVKRTSEMIKELEEARLKLAKTMAESEAARENRKK